MNSARAAHGVDCVYVTASARDARLARICVASIRAVYPDVPVRLLAGGRLDPALPRELARVWDVQPAPVPPGDYGWGFVKLEPLFAPEPHRFLMLDADTAFLGPALDGLADEPAPFVVDDEEQSDAEVRRLYYDVDAVRRVDLTAAAPAFVFNTGQWVGTSGFLTRDDFAPWLHWTLPRTYRHAGLFRQGDQGLLNYVLNQKVQRDGLAVARRPLMRWPGHDMSDVRSSTVALGPRSPHAQIGHWAGFKAARLGALPRADLLVHFERLHYAALGGGEPSRLVRAVQDAIRWQGRLLETKFRQRVASVRS